MRNDFRGPSFDFLSSSPGGCTPGGARRRDALQQFSRRLVIGILRDEFATKGFGQNRLIQPRQKF